MKRLLLWAVAMLIALTGSALLGRERDAGYALLLASPFVLFLSAASLWLVWKWATAPKWDRKTALSERATDRIEAECRPRQGPSEALVAKKVEQPAEADRMRAAGPPG
jgi:hypothetical protein